MRRFLLLYVPFVVGLGVVGSAGPARAKVLELWLQAQGGGIYGLYGTEKYDPASGVTPAKDDFFRAHSGAAFGAQAGVEVFFVDLIVDFAQLADDHGLSGTLTSFLLGFDWDFALSDRWLITPFGMVGFGLATYDDSWLKKEYPQISKADLEARAALVRVGARIEFKIHELFRIGVEGGFGYHYVLQTDKAANDLEGHSHGFHVYGMGILRFQWEPFKKKARKPEPKRTTVPAARIAEPRPETARGGNQQQVAPRAPARPSSPRPDSNAETQQGTVDSGPE